MLDEMPYGDFIEIEGESVAAVQTLAEQLSLDSSKAIKMSYLEIFDLLCSVEGFDMDNLTFDALSNKRFDFKKIAILSAD
jgi:hypothetical protein